MVTALFSRRNSSKTAQLQANLKKITGCGVLDIPKEMIDLIIEESHDEEGRREIMRHLRECLADGAKQWKRIHASFVLIEALAQRGSGALLAETAEGRHFDIIQRLSLLEHFSLPSDRRVETMLRTKATKLRSEIIHRLESGSFDEPEKETTSTCSPESFGSANASTAASVTSRHEEHEHGVDLSRILNPIAPKGPMVLNGIVTVGHNDDTTDESGDERPPPRHAEKSSASNSRRRASDNSESEGSSRQDAATTASTPAPSSSPPPPPAAPQADLLDFGESPPAQPAERPVDSGNLLDL
mmetsp:Transcript_79556/g.221353  ORF Transcript_79556/g.221353 Transcript_79556/m.221353 type:complete len:299 (-) Transcript_79556:197-1093(-)